MLKINLLHNPNAGEEDFSEKELTRLIQNTGFDCRYSSVKDEDWHLFDDDCDYLVVAGGDGTVRRAGKALLRRKLLQKQFPIGLLPHGTANNIAKSLDIKGSLKSIAKSWTSGNKKKFDIGKVTGIDGDMFFLEGLGFGIFPRLIKVMEKFKKELSNDVAQKIKVARAVLYDIVLSYEATECKIIADGVEYNGKYLLIEVMNTPSVGPNLQLTDGNPLDGELEIVLVPDQHRIEMQDYILKLINGEEAKPAFTIVKAKNVEIVWGGKDLHVDDERLKIEPDTTIKIEIMPGMLEFLTE